MSISSHGRKTSRVIVIVSIITGICLLGDSMLYIALPIFWKEAGLDSLWQVGILLSINRFIRLPMNPLVGWAYKKISLKTGLLAAVVLGSATTLGYGIVNGFVGWVILRGLWGIAWSFFRIGGLSAVAYYSDEKYRGEAMGVYNGLYRLGSLFGMLLGGIFVPIIGLKMVSIIFGILSFIGIPFIIVSLKNNIVTHQEKKTPIEKKLQGMSAFRKKFNIILSAFLIAMLFQGALTSTLSSVIEHHQGQTITIFGLIVSVTLLSGLLQAARWAWEPFLGRRFGYWSDGPKGRIPIYAASLLLTGLTFGLISSKLPLVLWIAVTLFVMIGATSLTTVTDAIALDVAKTTNVVGFLTIHSISLDIGAACGPFIGYILLEMENGLSYLYWGGSAIFISLAILWFTVYLIEKKSIGKSSAANEGISG